jgi:hypothetical protein
MKFTLQIGQEVKFSRTIFIDRARIMYNPPVGHLTTVSEVRDHSLALGRHRLKSWFRGRIRDVEILFFSLELIELDETREDFGV